MLRLASIGLRLLGPLVWIVSSGCILSTQTPDTFGNTCAAPQDGVLSIQWTIDGQSPTDALCANVARLQLTVSGACGGYGMISPIPCNLTKVRFDRQPHGSLDLLLEAIGPSEQLLASGTATVQATSQPPSAPSLIELLTH